MEDLWDMLHYSILITAAILFEGWWPHKI